MTGSDHRSLTGTAPVIVIGMHRSGTAMVVRALRQLGLFAGWRREPNEEATLFLELNKWVFEQLGGRWDRPPDIRDLLDSEPVRELAFRYLRRLLTGPRSLSFLGPQRFLRSRSIFALNGPWGWKDPRTTVTLPLWLGLFPEARVVHIKRHGVDVARSLQTREQRRLQAGQNQIDRFSWAYAFRPKRYGFVGSLRCLSLGGGFSLWEDYLEAARQGLEPLGTHALELRYEDLLDEPAPALLHLADFCGLQQPSSGRLSAITGQFDRKRRLAYRRDPSLAETAVSWDDRLTRWGYSP